MMVSLLRLGQDLLNPNLGAAEFNDGTRPEVATTKSSISDRAWKAKNKAAGQIAENMLADRMDRWIKEAGRMGRQLGYETRRRQGDVVALLKKPSAAAWDELTVPMSMREVEPGVQLIMDDTRMTDPPQWRVPSQPTPPQGGAK